MNHHKKHSISVDDIDAKYFPSRLKNIDLLNQLSPVLNNYPKISEARFFETA